MKVKMKTCAGCLKQRTIYKSHGTKKFCKLCWGKYLQGNAPSGIDSKVKTISKVSSKKEKADYLYAIARKAYLQNKPMCEAKLPGCGLNATDIHHKKGRIGQYYLDTTYFLAVCRSCHNIIEENVEMAKEAGFSKNRLTINDEEN
jgi:ribosomal protein S27E